MSEISLATFRKVRGRFARSTNVERDAGTASVNGYLPTGRSMDVVRRFASALESGCRALSITGPYGSGKSSLGVFLDALVRPAGDGARQAAEEICGITEPETLALLDEGRRSMGGDNTGFIRALATAEREAVTLTVLRALHRGAEQFEARGNKQKAVRSRALRMLKEAIERFGDTSAGRPTAQTIRQMLDLLASLAPILLLIDEFGKNLEGYTDDPAEGDLYVLQQMAEWSGASGGVPLVVITMQHLAFADYVSSASEVQRRELAKIQGRFEDIPFVDNAQQTRSLIAAAWEPCTSDGFARALAAWAKEHGNACSEGGLSELLGGDDAIAGCWPLHPVAQLVLPELCARYGQHERTLFSFLAGAEPGSVATFLQSEMWDGKAPLPSIGVDRLYDYFIESAGALVAVSQSASRWLEIETMVRDTVGLNNAQRRALKTVGILNLVSAGGGLRASRVTVAYALVSGSDGTISLDEARQVLDSLEARGLLIFRDFADEYRMWQGSDFDLRSAIETARRRLRTANPEAVLSRVRPLRPVVAGRHSQQTHTLRAFARSWIDESTSTVCPPSWADPMDGLLVYAVSHQASLPRVVSSEQDPKPVVAVISSATDALVTAATEVAALQEVLATEERLDTDWVVRRELSERIAEASQRLDAEFEASFGSGASVRWARLVAGKSPEFLHAAGNRTSSVISFVANEAYRLAPHVRNEMLNRAELTSQGAKARRELLEAMVTKGSEPLLGITGYGPERAMYAAALSAPGIHRQKGERWGFHRPQRGSTFERAWGALVDELRKAKVHRIGLDEVVRRLCAPPIGMRPGAAAVLLTAILVSYADEVAIYEHGTYRPVFSADVSERMVRNPAHFEIKHFAAKGGVRAHVVAALTERLSVSPAGSRQRNGSVLAVLGHLMTRVVLPLPEYARRTGRLSPPALSVRSALVSATEPDQLLFRLLPERLGHAPVPLAAPKHAWARHCLWVDEFVNALSEMSACYGRLLDEMEQAIVEATGAAPGQYRTQLAGRAASLQSDLIDPRLRAFVVSLEAPLDRVEWLAYVGSTVAQRPPESWTDEDRARCLLLIHELGAAFRRVEALHYERKALSSTPSNVVRVTFTLPGGEERARLLWVDELQEQAVQVLFDDFVERAADVVGSSNRARDVALALLAASSEGAQPAAWDHRTGSEADVADATLMEGRKANDG